MTLIIIITRSQKQTLGILYEFILYTVLYRMNDGNGRWPIMLLAPHEESVLVVRGGCFGRGMERALQVAALTKQRARFQLDPLPPEARRTSGV